MEHISLKDQLNESFRLRLYYYLGILKPVPKQYTYRNQYRYGFKVRLIHPFSWFGILATLIVHGFNKSTLNQIKANLTLI